jgi:hypothetical protein
MYSSSGDESDVSISLLIILLLLPLWLVPVTIDIVLEMPSTIDPNQDEGVGTVEDSFENSAEGSLEKEEEEEDDDVVITDDSSIDRSFSYSS